MSSSPEPEHLDNRHRNTLRQIFQHPVSHNIEWRSVTSLLDAIGTVDVHHDGQVAVRVGSESAFFKHPEGKDIDEQMVLDLRRMLSEGRLRTVLTQGGWVGCGSSSSGTTILTRPVSSPTRSRARGAEPSVHLFPDGGPLPALDGVDHVVVLGAVSSVNDPDPWITAELAWLRAADQAGVPVLGICFGRPGALRRAGRPGGGDDAPGDRLDDGRLA